MKTNVKYIQQLLIEQLPLMTEEALNEAIPNMTSEDAPKKDNAEKL